MANRLDVIIFGASGFTGKSVIDAAEILTKKNLSWGIAGRNKDKLKMVLNEVGQKNGINLSNIPIILADVNDMDSIDRMAQQAKVLN